MMFMVMMFSVLVVVCVLGVFGYKYSRENKINERMDMLDNVEGLPVPQAISKLRQAGMSATATPEVIEFSEHLGFKKMPSRSEFPSGIDVLLTFDPKTNTVTNGFAGGMPSFGDDLYRYVLSPLGYTSVHSTV